jgi:galactofuranose transport system substrate-binding protein
MKRLYFLLLSIVISATFVLSGCSSTSTSKTVNKETRGANPAKGSKKNIILGFSQIGSESKWRIANSESIKSAAKDAGIELLFDDAQQKQEQQIKAIREFIAKKVDIISFSPVVTTGWDEVLNEAKDAKIPVIITDRAIETKDDSLYLSVIGSDFKEEGIKAGKWLIDYLKQTKKEMKIYELVGTVGSAPAVERQKGFAEAIKDYPNLKIVKSKTGDFTKAKGKETMKAFLADGAKFDILFSHNDDMAFGAIEAMEEKGLKPGKDVVVLSVDAVKEAFDYMIKGKINCTVECSPLLGPQLMEAVKQVLDGKKIERNILTKESIFPAESAKKELPNRKY